jgi:hypothetical protein
MVQRYSKWGDKLGEPGVEGWVQDRNCAACGIYQIRKIKNP